MYTRFKPTRARRRTRSWGYWFLTLLGLGLVGWVFWHLPQRPEPPPSAPKAPPATPPLPTNRLAPLPILPAPLTNPSPQAALPLRPDLLPTPPTTPSNPPAPPRPTLPRPVQNTLEAQIVMARQGISPGSLDGVLGFQTRAALAAFQRQHRLPRTGTLDAATRAALLVDDPPLTTYTVTTNDVARLLPLSRTWLEKSEQPRMDYETVLELVAEKAHAHPNLIRRLNPRVEWSSVFAGTTLVVPNASGPLPRSAAALVRIRLADKMLEAFDSATNLIAHFPCSIARQVEKRPVGDLYIAVIARNPNYTFDPDVFPESPEAQQLGQKLILQPGPNNPVGTAWIGLSRPGYGIHGTPNPEDVGRTESHGCFRLANWNAEYLAQIVAVGTPVSVEP